MTAREAVLEDCDTIAEIHLRAFKDFFLSTLGHRFLKTFYKICIKSPGAVTVVCCSPDGEITGFALASVSAKDFYRKLLVKNALPFLKEAIILLLSKPRALLRLALNLSKSGDESTDMAELLSIASLPLYKGKGVGKILIKSLEERLLKINVRGITLTTDYYKNEDAIRFYESSGYSITGEFIAYPARKMLRMSKSLQ